jgi:peptidoglycan hydrolase-like protein with peptidoglycan-binding domain
MDLVEVAQLYREALGAKNEVVRDVMSQAIAQAAAAQAALAEAQHDTVGAAATKEGSSVRRLQLRLCERGAELKIDGRFGPKTKSALTGFQKANGLKADGVAGPVTWASLGVSSDAAVARALSDKAHAELAAFEKLSKRAVKKGDLAAAEALAAEAVAAESLAAEAIAAETMAAEAAENVAAGEPVGAEAAIAEAAIAEGIAETSEALEAFVAEAARPQG